MGIFLIYCNYVVAMTMTNSKYCIYIEKGAVKKVPY